MSRRSNRGDSRHYYDWLEFASADLAAADLLLLQPQCAGAAGFHCQQAVEKALKAYILFQTRNGVDGHNITWLCRTAAKLDRHFYTWLDETPAFNRLYIETRYPADIPTDLDDRKLTHIYRVAAEIYDYICGEVYENSDIEED